MLWHDDTVYIHSKSMCSVSVLQQASPMHIEVGHIVMDSASACLLRSTHPLTTLTQLQQSKAFQAKLGTWAEVQDTFDQSTVREHWQIRTKCSLLGMAWLKWQGTRSQSDMTWGGNGPGYNTHISCSTDSSWICCSTLNWLIAQYIFQQLCNSIRVM